MTARSRDVLGNSPAHNTLGKIVEYTDVTPEPFAKISAVLFLLYEPSVPAWAAAPRRLLHEKRQALSLSARD